MTLLDPAVAAFIREATGLEADRVGEAAIEATVRDFMAQTQVRDSTALVERLRDDAALSQRFINALTVPETWFFRDEVPFEYLAAHLREDVAKQRRRIAALSLPCASGEEAYSIAIIAHAAGIPASRCQVDAVDINTDLLDVAREGIYGDHAFRSPLAVWQSGYFETVAGHHRVIAPVRRYVEFHRGNVFDFPLELRARRYDVVFFRNLLIYLNHDLQQRALELVGELLKPGGLLFVGHAEGGLVKSPRFAAVERGGAFAFRRVPAGETASRAERSSASSASQPVAPHAAGKREAAGARSDTKAALPASRIEAILPEAVMADAKGIDDCWNRIGTWGTKQPRCARLPSVGTCVNCDIYRQAGHRLLDREAPQGYLEEWRAFLATPLRKGDATASFYLLFAVQRQLVALHTSVLEYVADASTIRRLPHRRDPLLLGVAAVKNEVLPCIALARLLDGSAARESIAASANAYRRFVVTRFGDGRWILPVDDVVALQRFERAQIVGEGLAEESLGSPVVQGAVTWENQRILVIDSTEVSRRLGEMAQ